MNKTEQLRKPKQYQQNPVQARFQSSQGYSFYLFPLALVPAVILSFMFGDFLAIITNIVGCISFLLAAKLLSKGLANEREYQQKKITQAPKSPLKTFAALLTAINTTAIAFIGADNSLWVSLAFGLGAFAGMVLFYGLDPRQEKMIEGSHGFSAEEISQTIDEALAKISGLESANQKIKDRDFTKRLNAICANAKEVVTMIEENPSDIRRARKFLNVYLDGALKVTQGYADMQYQHQQLTDNFDHVLQTIESVFIEQKQKLMEDDVLDLDVQIEVLSIQLKKEGVL